MAFSSKGGGSENGIRRVIGRHSRSSSLVQWRSRWRLIAVVGASHDELKCAAQSADLNALEVEAMLVGVYGEMSSRWRRQKVRGVEA